MKKVIGIIILALLLLGVTTVLANHDDYLVSDQGIAPVYYNDGPGGNVECSQVGVYEYASPRFANDAQWQGSWAGIVWETVDNKFVFWQGAHDGLAIIVKGGSGANVYSYTDMAITNDGHLVSPPVGQNHNIPELSNITFCWNPPPAVCEWIGETAWAAGNRYVSKGNWATYTPYEVDTTVTLYAGQHMEAGTVHFSAVVDGEVTITIELNSGWQLEDVEEAVKIQGYNEAPSGNPAPGQFTTYKGNDLTVTVPAHAIYGVHLNVEWESCE
jgi:hypothetical protein